MAKFNAGESGKRKKGDKISKEKQVGFMKKMSSKEEQAAKLEAGKLMKDEDDKKEDLDNATIWATMHKAGGPLAWVAIVLSFFVTEIFSKWGDYQLQSLSTDSTAATEGAEAGDSGV